MLGQILEINVIKSTNRRRGDSYVCLSSSLRWRFLLKYFRLQYGMLSYMTRSNDLEVGYKNWPVLTFFAINKIICVCLRNICCCFVLSPGCSIFDIDSINHTTDRHCSESEYEHERNWKEINDLGKFLPQTARLRSSKMWYFVKHSLLFHSSS